MGAKPYTVVAIDLGSAKTCVLMSQPGENDRLEVKGFGEAESRGWRKGIIVNLDAASMSVKKAVEAAEAQAGFAVDGGYIGVAGPHIRGVNSRGGLNLGKLPALTREVTSEEIGKVIQTAQNITLPPDRVRLYVEQQEYLLDSQNGIRNPLGMVGARLEANVHLITASATAHQNVVTAVNRAGVEVKDTVFEPLAAALSSLSADDRELGVALIDIGAGSSDMVIYFQGAVRHTAVIPIGGDHFTNDIAVGLRTPVPEAEKMKRLWGERDPQRPLETLLEIPSVGERPMRTISYATLSEIIEPRALELLEHVQGELDRSGFGEQLGSGVVLVGGGAKLGGFVALAEQMLALPVRLGVPRGLGRMGDVLPDPAYSTLVGLIAYGNRLQLRREAEEKSWAGRIMDVLRGRSDS